MTCQYFRQSPPSQHLHNSFKSPSQSADIIDKKKGGASDEKGGDEQKEIIDIQTKFLEKSDEMGSPASQNLRQNYGMIEKGNAEDVLVFQVFNS